MQRIRHCAPALILAAAGCGYQPVYGSPAPEKTLSLVAAPSRIPRVELTQAALQGARAELARSGALRAEPGYPRMVIELLRLDELGTGIAAAPSLGGDGELPLARGMAIGVVGRGWVVEAPGAAPLRDTGDVRRVESVADQAEPVLDGLARDEAAHAAARAVGEVLARRVLGEPRAGLEEM